MAQLARLIASGMGAGLAPRAPGTAGSLAALLAGAALLSWTPGALILAAAIAVPVGIWAVGASRAAGDPGWVVIDEVAGQWIAMLPLAQTGWSWRSLLAAFALFRLLDIAKPGPVGWADRRSGPAAVMADDVVAGLIAAALLWALLRTAPGLLDAGMSGRAG